ncbi:hypothetical protein AGMMS49928_22960 [Spirochaetia bacterium]|nr:hypothetical protein AGMMS49928_22960 [Spirochaetia bacterium]
MIIRDGIGIIRLVLRLAGCLLLFALFAACQEPVPLYGTWADNRGNNLSFFDDGSFNASITAAGTQKNYSGNWSILLNALTLYKIAN